MNSNGDFLQNPVAHCWSDPFHHKRKFCNVCRKRLDDSESIHCESKFYERLLRDDQLENWICQPLARNWLVFFAVCDYFVHTECQDFAVADCKENATYLPGKHLASVNHEHHWREGNLPNNSKCALCKKTCMASECLSGFRCEWCGMTVSHVTCQWLTSYPNLLYDFSVTHHATRTSHRSAHLEYLNPFICVLTQSAFHAQKYRWRQ